MIGKRGPVCAKCGQPVFPKNGGYVHARKGRFRDFLRRVVTNHALKILRSRRDQAPLDGLAHAIPDPSCNCDEQWENEWRQYMKTCEQGVRNLKKELFPIDCRA